jgi:GT2 family glycosyltransferase
VGTAATATVIVVSRDRWSLAPATLDLLVARTDRRHPIVVVDGGAPRGVAAVFDRVAATGRIRVTRRRRFLASNEARNIGADGVRTEWIAFVENDSELSDGWLERLLEIAEARGAASAYPAYLELRAGAPMVHGVGADLTITGPSGARQLREHEYDVGRPWSEVADRLVPVERIQAEPHALVIRREMLEAMGGLDEGLLSWFDHMDLALHHQRLSASAVLVPHVTCLYRVPPPIAWYDVPSFLLRWGGDWFERSRQHFCATWGLSLHDQELWNRHARYRTTIRRHVLTPWSKVNACIDRGIVPIERLAVHQWNTQRDRERMSPRAPARR